MSRSHSHEDHLYRDIIVLKDLASELKGEERTTEDEAFTEDSCASNCSKSARSRGSYYWCTEQ